MDEAARNAKKEWNGIVPRSPVTHSNGFVQGVFKPKSEVAPPVEYLPIRLMELQAMDPRASDPAEEFRTIQNYMQRVMDDFDFGII